MITRRWGGSRVQGGLSCRVGLWFLTVGGWTESCCPVSPVFSFRQSHRVSDALRQTCVHTSRRSTFKSYGVSSNRTSRYYAAWRMLHALCRVFVALFPVLCRSARGASFPLLRLVLALCCFHWVPSLCVPPCGAVVL